MAATPATDQADVHWVDASCGQECEGKMFATQTSSKTDKNRLHFYLDLLDARLLHLQ